MVADNWSRPATQPQRGRFSRYLQECQICVSVDRKGTQNLKSLALPDQLCRSAPGPLNHVGVGGDDVVRNEKTATDAKRLSI